MTLALRRACAADAGFFWRVNNDPSVREQSITAAPIPWPSHVAWFSRKLNDPKALLYVGSELGEDVAVARFDLAESEAIISIAVVPSAQGRGFGRAMIEEATRALRSCLHRQPAVALIRPGNFASLRAFARAGYRRDGVVEVTGVLLERWKQEVPPQP